MNTSIELLNPINVLKPTLPTYTKVVAAMGLHVTCVHPELVNWRTYSPIDRLAAGFVENLVQRDIVGGYLPAIIVH